MDHEFEPNPEKSCKCTFFSVLIIAQHTNERESFSLLTNTGYGKLVLTFFTVAIITLFYLKYVALHESRPLSKLMLYRTTGLLYETCDDTGQNRYSILSTSPYRSNISFPPHYSEFQTYGSELERSLSCFYEV